MSRKRVVLRERARRDAEDAVDHYLREAGDQVALGFVDALEGACGYIARQPAAGSSRHAHELNMPGLCSRRFSRSSWSRSRSTRSRSRRSCAALRPRSDGVGEPLRGVIMLNELPPYFVNAASRSIGNSDTSVVTATALANLLVARPAESATRSCACKTPWKRTATGTPSTRSSAGFSLTKSGSSPAASSSANTSTRSSGLPFNSRATCRTNRLASTRARTAPARRSWVADRRCCRVVPVQGLEPRT